MKSCTYGIVVKIDQEISRELLAKQRFGSFMITMGSLEDGFVYLFEGQQRVGRLLIDKSGYRDTLPILMLRRADWQSVDANEVAEILRETVSNPSKTWPNPIRAFIRQSIEHGNGADTPEKLALRIAGVVKKNLPEGSFENAQSAVGS